MPRSFSAFVNWFSTASRHAFEVAAVLVEQHAFLTQRHEDRGRLFEEPRERVELLAHFFSPALPLAWLSCASESPFAESVLIFSSGGVRMRSKVSCRADVR